MDDNYSLQTLHPYQCEKDRAYMTPACQVSSRLNCSLIFSIKTSTLATSCGTRVLHDDLPPPQRFLCLAHSDRISAQDSDPEKPLVFPTGVERSTVRIDLASAHNSNAYFPSASPVASTFLVGNPSTCPLTATNPYLISRIEPTSLLYLKPTEQCC